MDIFTLFVDLLLVMWVVAVLVAIVRAWQARVPRLVPLSPDARIQFVNAWHRIAAEFVDAPREAVYQADSLILSLLRERGRPVRPDRPPKPIQEARRELEHERTNGTEALRQAMLRYRSIFTRSIGRRPQEKDDKRTGRREMA